MKKKISKAFLIALTAVFTLSMTACFGSGGRRRQSYQQPGGVKRVY